MQAELAVEAEDVGATIGHRLRRHPTCNRPHRAGAADANRPAARRGPAPMEAAMKPRRRDRPAARDAGEQAKEWELCLYVAGQSPRSVTASPT